MIRIVMDSAGDTPSGWLEEYDIQIIPINIHFGNQMFLQGIDLSNADFYRLVDESGVIPQTSQPTPQQFIDFYKRIAEPGDTILSIHITSKLSGTLDSAVIAARELTGQYNVVPLDSASGSAAMGYMCREARLMARAGAAVNKIVDRIKFLSRNTQIVLTLNTLEYAKKSGRVKALQAALASLLNVKPIIVLREGVIELEDRVRTRQKSLDFVIDKMAGLIGKQQVNAAVVHAEDPGAGQQLLDKVRSKLDCAELILTELSTGIAANLGPGTVGLVTLPISEGL
jgi:DegV family protein with EDD domain